MLSAYAVDAAAKEPKSGANTIVNINKASASQIADALDGVGMSRAKAIVAYRKNHGPFKSLSALTVIKGVGDKTIEVNRKRMRLK